MERKKKQLNVWIPPDIIKNVKRICVEKETNLSNLIEELLKKWIDENK